MKGKVSGQGGMRCVGGMGRLVGGVDGMGRGTCFVEGRDG